MRKAGFPILQLIRIIESNRIAATHLSKSIPLITSNWLPKWNSHPIPNQFNDICTNAFINSFRHDYDVCSPALCFRHWNHTQWRCNPRRLGTRLNRLRATHKPQGDAGRSSSGGEEKKQKNLSSWRWIICKGMGRTEHKQAVENNVKQGDYFDHFCISTSI